ncbi:MAG: 50S ribosomal protein L9 [Planctomycetes bacterium]|nr:50S ribosomal protein L9 [Planctomycetota bacterium]
MKVLLCQDVEKLGWLGDVVEVKNGYARNYLLPCGIAIVPSESNIRGLAHEKARGSEERKLAHEKLVLVLEVVEGAEAVISAKANELGHLFGSVSDRDIAVNLREQGYEIADNMVVLDEHIKDVGTHEVSLKLAADLIANISVVVVSEDAVIDAEEPVADEGASEVEKAE